MKKTEDAVLIYQKVISEYKSEDEARISAYNWLAKIYEAKRKYKEAINMYEELLKIIKKKEIWGEEYIAPDIMFSLAMNYDCLFEYRKSIPLYKEIIEKYPNYIRIKEVKLRLKGISSLENKEIKNK